MHKWSLINRALDFGHPEPVETYSSSPHLYEELNIPAGAKGRIAAPRAAEPEGAADGRTESSTAAPTGTRTRTRRRTGGGGERTAEHRESRAETGPHAEHVPGSGAHDGTGSPQRRRRRRGTRPSAPSA
jgi:hypothetical protein